MKFNILSLNARKVLDELSPYPALYPFLMSEPEKTLFDQAVSQAHHYLEFGMGGSTLRAIRKSRANIYSVESDTAWINNMRRYRVVRRLEGSRFFQKRRLRIMPVDIGPTSAWGFPAADTQKDCFGAYSSGVFQKIDAGLLDLVLIDGRFRVACTLSTILACRESRKVKILIHDFWNRPKYHLVLKYLDPLQHVDTLGLFRIKDDTDPMSISADYETYKFNPD